MNDQIVLGIDAGGTHITIAPVDLHNREVLNNFTHRIAFDSNGNVNDVILNWAKAIRQVAAASAIRNVSIGFAFPGPFDYEKGVCLIRNQNKYEKFFNLNIRDLLSEELQIDGDNLFFMNDAACFLKGELFNNPGLEKVVPLGVTLGTGLGTSKLSNGCIVDAELWSIPFMEGIAEDYLSSRWFLGKYYSFFGKRISSVKEISANASGKNLWAQNGCIEIFNEFGINLADFFSEVYANIQQDTIILGGNISKAWLLFESSFKKRLANNGHKMTVHLSSLGEQAAVMGAASLCMVKK